jgi:hypothetical protein
MIKIKLLPNFLVRGEARLLWFDATCGFGTCVQNPFKDSKPPPVAAEPEARQTDAKKADANHQICQVR